MKISDLKNTTKSGGFERVKKIMQMEGAQLGKQFDEYNELFELLSYSRRCELSELETYCMLSNRFTLVKNVDAKIKFKAFYEFREYVESIPVPSQRLGSFNIDINNKGRMYSFKSLKTSVSLNNDLFGFSLNHYQGLGLPKQQYKTSVFHDNEDINVDIYECEFIEAYKMIYENKILLKTKRWSATITWD